MITYTYLSFLGQLSANQHTLPVRGSALCSVALASPLLVPFTNSNWSRLVESSLIMKSILIFRRLTRGLLLSPHTICSALPFVQSTRSWFCPATVLDFLRLLRL